MEYAKEENMMYMETSAKARINIVEAFTKLSQTVIDNHS